MCPLDLNLVLREPRAEPQCERGRCTTPTGNTMKSEEQHQLIQELFVLQRVAQRILEDVRSFTTGQSASDDVTVVMLCAS